MTMPLGRRWEWTSAAAVLAGALILSPGCGREESGPPQPPAPPPAQRADPGGAMKDISGAANDLRKDLKPPVVEPGGQAARTAPPPATKAGTP